MKKESEISYTRLISHQLKSPINAIQSLLQTINDGYTGSIPPQTKYTLEKALSRAAEASQTVTELLEYERYSGSEEIEMEKVELLSMVEQNLKFHGITASEKDISLTTDIPSHLEVFVKGHAPGLEQVFTNLVENAIKYTPPMGSIYVKGEITGGSKQFVVTVRDTGDGIPQDELPNLFLPFFRAKKHKKSVPGTGLGLAIVKRIVETHNGSVKADSKEGEGTSFIVSLPILELKEQSTAKRKPKQVLIIGGVTSGPKAAARLRRLSEEIDIAIVEETDFLSYTGCEIPRYISNTIESSQDLLSTSYNRMRNSQFFKNMKNIITYNHNRALSIDVKKQEVLVEDLREKVKRLIPYDSLVLATGSRPAFPDIRGINNEKVYTVHSLQDARKLKQQLSRSPAQEGCIIGGGLIGTSMAQSLLEMGTRLTILEKASSLLPSYLDPEMARKLEIRLSRRGIKIVTKVIIEEIIEADDGAEVIIGTSKGPYRANFVILCTGVTPNSCLARDAGLRIGPFGGIAVDESMQTSNDRIYAIGDCAETSHLLSGEHEYWPLGSVSTKMGRLVADSIIGRKVRFPGSLGTTMLSCFSVKVARTGLTESRAKELGYAVESVVITGVDRLYRQGEDQHIFFKLICDRNTRLVLGAQAVGEGNVPEKISLAATCISSEMTIDEIFVLDLGYSPEFTLPIDILQTAAGVLGNKVDGLLKTIRRGELENLDAEVILLEINPIPGNRQFSIAGSIEINPEQLRQGVLSISKKDRIILYCKTSNIAYQSYRFLVNTGYESVQLLEGGYLFWE